MEAVKNFFSGCCGTSEKGRPGPGKCVLEQECPDDKKPGDRVYRVFVASVFSSRRRFYGPVGLADGDEDGVPGMRVRGSVTEIQVDHLLDGHAGMKGRGADVDPLGRPLDPHDLCTQQAPGSPLGQHLYRDLTRMRVVAGPRRALDPG